MKFNMFIITYLIFIVLSLISIIFNKKNKKVKSPFSESLASGELENLRIGDPKVIHEMEKNIFNENKNLSNNKGNTKNENLKIKNSEKISSKIEKNFSKEDSYTDKTKKDQHENIIKNENKLSVTPLPEISKANSGVVEVNQSKTTPIARVLNSKTLRNSSYNSNSFYLKYSSMIILVLLTLLF